VDNKQILPGRLPRGRVVGRTLRTTQPLGSLIAAAFDEAEKRSTDSKEVLRLATTSVQRMLRRGCMRRMTLQDLSLFGVEDR
jgi:hypothetical protein